MYTQVQRVQSHLIKDDLMATFLPNKPHHNKPKPTFTLSRSERYLFLLLTVFLTLGVVWKIDDSATQRKAITPLKQHQYLFNQACQQALNNGADRNVSYCTSAQHYDYVLRLALKDNHIDLSEAVELEGYFQRQYREFSNN